MDKEGFGSVSLVAKGIVYAAERGAKIINMSLGTQAMPTEIPILTEAIDAIKDSTVIIAAAGNDSMETLLFAPANHPAVIAVGSVNKNEKLSKFSNRGYGTFLVAPGENIISTLPNNNYYDLSGTSMAAPHIAGIAGLLLSINPSLKPIQVKTQLRLYAGSLEKIKDKDIPSPDLRLAKAYETLAGKIAPPMQSLIVNARIKEMSKNYEEGETITADISYQNPNSLSNNKATVYFITNPKKCSFIFNFCTTWLYNYKTDIPPNKSFTFSERVPFAAETLNFKTFWPDYDTTPFIFENEKVHFFVFDEQGNAAYAALNYNMTKKPSTVECQYEIKNTSSKKTEKSLTLRSDFHIAEFSRRQYKKYGFGNKETDVIWCTSIDQIDNEIKFCNDETIVKISYSEEEKKKTLTLKLKPGKYKYYNEVWSYGGYEGTGTCEFTIK